MQISTTAAKGGLNTVAYGAKMQGAREALGLSQTDAGKRLKKARETLSLMERGLFSYPPLPAEMRELEGLYGIPQIQQLSTLGYEVNPFAWRVWGRHRPWR